MLFRTMDCTKLAMSGMSTTGSREGSLIRDMALWAIVTARSPMRSRLVLIFSAAMMKRRLLAMG